MDKSKLRNPKKFPKNIQLSDFTLEALPLTSLEHPITAILCESDYLYVGCANGRLIRYPVRCQDTPRLHHIHMHTESLGLDPDQTVPYDPTLQPTSSTHKVDDQLGPPQNPPTDHNHHVAHASGLSEPITPEESNFIATILKQQGQQSTSPSAHGHPNILPPSVPLPSIWNLGSKIVKNVSGYHHTSPADAEQLEKARAQLPAPTPLNYQSLISPLHQLPSAIISIQKCRQNGWLIVQCNKTICIYCSQSLAYIDTVRAFPSTTVLSNSTLSIYTTNQTQSFPLTASTSQLLLFEKLDRGKWVAVDPKIHKQHHQALQYREKERQKEIEREKNAEEKRLRRAQKERIREEVKSIRQQQKEQQREQKDTSQNKTGKRELFSKLLQLGSDSDSDESHSDSAKTKAKRCDSKENVSQSRTEMTTTNPTNLIPNTTSSTTSPTAQIFMQSSISSSTSDLNQSKSDNESDSNTTRPHSPSISNKSLSSSSSSNNSVPSTPPSNAKSPPSAPTPSLSMTPSMSSTSSSLQRNPSTPSTPSTTTVSSSFTTPSHQTSRHQRSSVIPSTSHLSSHSSNPSNITETPSTYSLAKFNTISLLLHHKRTQAQFRKYFQYGAQNSTHHTHPHNTLTSQPTALSLANSTHTSLTNTNSIPITSSSFHPPSALSTAAFSLQSDQSTHLPPLSDQLSKQSSRGRSSTTYTPSIQPHPYNTLAFLLNNVYSTPDKRYNPTNPKPMSHLAPTLISLARKLTDQVTYLQYEAGLTPPGFAGHKSKEEQRAEAKLAAAALKKSQEQSGLDSLSSLFSSVNQTEVSSFSSFFANGILHIAIVSPSTKKLFFYEAHRGSQPIPASGPGGQARAGTPAQHTPQLTNSKQNQNDIQLGPLLLSDDVSGIAQGDSALSSAGSQNQQIPLNSAFQLTPTTDQLGLAPEQLSHPDAIHSQNELSKHMQDLFEPTSEEKIIREWASNNVPSTAITTPAVARIIWKLRGVFHTGDHAVLNLQFLSIYFVAFATRSNAYLLNINTHTVRSILDICLESVLSSHMSVVMPDIASLPIVPSSSFPTSPSLNSVSITTSQAIDASSPRTALTIQQFGTQQFSTHQSTALINQFTTQNPGSLRDSGNQALTIESHANFNTIDNTHRTQGSGAAAGFRFSLTSPRANLNTLTNHTTSNSPTSPQIASHPNPNLISAPRSLTNHNPSSTASEPINPYAMFGSLGNSTYLRSTLSNHNNTTHGPASSLGPFSPTGGQSGQFAGFSATYASAFDSYTAKPSSVGSLHRGLFNFPINGMISSEYTLNDPQLQHQSFLQPDHQQNPSHSGIKPNNIFSRPGQGQTGPDFDSVSQYDLQLTRANFFENAMQLHPIFSIHYSAKWFNSPIDPYAQFLSTTNPYHYPPISSSQFDPLSVYFDPYATSEYLDEQLLLFPPQHHSLLQTAAATAQTSSVQTSFHPPSPAFLTPPSVFPAVNTPAELIVSSLFGPERAQNLTFSSPLPTTAPGQVSQIRLQLSQHDRARYEHHLLRPPPCDVPISQLLSQTFRYHQPTTVQILQYSLQATHLYNNLLNSNFYEAPSDHSSNPFSSPSNTHVPLREKLFDRTSFGTMNSLSMSQASDRASGKAEFSSGFGTVPPDSNVPTHFQPGAGLAFVDGITTTGKHHSFTGKESSFGDSKEPTPFGLLQSFLASLPDKCRNGVHPPTIHYLRDGELSVCFGRYLFFLRDLAQDPYNSASSEHTAHYPAIADVTIDVPFLNNNIAANTADNTANHPTQQVQGYNAQLHDDSSSSTGTMSHFATNPTASPQSSTNIPNSPVPSTPSIPSITEGQPELNSPQHAQQHAIELLRAPSQQDRHSSNTTNSAPSQSQQQLPTASTTVPISIHPNIVPIAPTVQQDGTTFDGIFCSQPQSLPVNPLRMTVISELQYYAFANWNELNTHVHYAVNAAADPSNTFNNELSPEQLAINNNVAFHTHSSENQLEGCCSSCGGLTGPQNSGNRILNSATALIESALYGSTQSNLGTACTNLLSAHSNNDIAGLSVHSGEITCSSQVPTTSTDSNSTSTPISTPQSTTTPNLLNNHPAVPHCSCHHHQYHHQHTGTVPTPDSSKLPFIPPSLSKTLNSSNPNPLLTSNTGLYFLLTSIQESHLIRIDCTRTILPLPVYVPKDVFINRQPHSITTSPIIYSHSRYQLPPHLITMPIYSSMLLHSASAAAQVAHLEDENLEQQLITPSITNSTASSQPGFLPSTQSTPNTAALKSTGIDPLNQSTIGMSSPNPNSATTNNALLAITQSSLNELSQFNLDDSAFGNGLFQTLSPSMNIKATRLDGDSNPNGPSSPLSRSQQSQSSQFPPPDEPLPTLHRAPSGCNLLRCVVSGPYQNANNAKRSSIRPISPTLYSSTPNPQSPFPPELAQPQGNSISLDLPVAIDQDKTLKQHLTCSPQILTTFLLHAPFTYNYSLQYMQSINFSFAPPFQATNHFQVNCSASGKARLNSTTPSTESVNSPQEDIVENKINLDRRSVQAHVQNIASVHFGTSSLFPVFSYRGHIWYFQPVPSNAENPVKFFASLTKYTNWSTVMKKIAVWIRGMLDDGSSLFGRSVQLFSNYICWKYGMQMYQYIYTISQQEDLELIERDKEYEKALENVFAEIWDGIDSSKVQRQLYLYNNPIKRQASTAAIPELQDPDVRLVRSLYFINGTAIPGRDVNNSGKPVIDVRPGPSIPNSISLREIFDESLVPQLLAEIDLYVSQLSDTICLKYSFSAQRDLYSELRELTTSIIRNCLFTQTKYCLNPLFQLRFSHQEVSLQRVCDVYYKAQPYNFCLNEFTLKPDSDDQFFDDLLKEVVQYRQSLISARGINNDESSPSPSLMLSTSNPLVSDGSINKSTSTLIHSPVLKPTSNDAESIPQTSLQCDQANQGNQTEPLSAEEIAAQTLTAQEKKNGIDAQTLHSLNLIPQQLPTRIHPSLLGALELAQFNPAVDILREVGLTFDLKFIFDRVYPVVEASGMMTKIANAIYLYRRQKIEIWRSFKDTLRQTLEWKKIGDHLKAIAIQAKKRFGYTHPYHLHSVPQSFNDSASRTLHNSNGGPTLELIDEPSDTGTERPLSSPPSLDETALTSTLANELNDNQFGEGQSPGSTPATPLTVVTAPTSIFAELSRERNNTAFATPRRNQLTHQHQNQNKLTPATLQKLNQINGPSNNTGLNIDPSQAGIMYTTARNTPADSTSPVQAVSDNFSTPQLFTTKQTLADYARERRMTSMNPLRLNGSKKYCTCYDLDLLPHSITSLLGATGTQFDSLILNIIYSEEEFTIPPCRCEILDENETVPEFISSNEFTDFDPTTTWYRGELNLQAVASGDGDSSSTVASNALSCSLDSLLEGAAISTRYKTIQPFLQIAADQLLPLISYCFLRANSRTLYHQTHLNPTLALRRKLLRFILVRDSYEPGFLASIVGYLTSPESHIYAQPTRQRVGSGAGSMNGQNPSGPISNTTKFSSQQHKKNQFNTNADQLPVSQQYQSLSQLSVEQICTLLTYTPHFGPVTIAKIEHARSTNCLDSGGSEAQAILNAFGSLLAMADDLVTPDQIQRLQIRNNRMTTMIYLRQHGNKPNHQVQSKNNTAADLSSQFGNLGIGDDGSANIFDAQGSPDEDGENQMATSASSYQDRVKNITNRHRKSALLGAALYVAPNILEDYFL